jgi:hypothetical protein
MSVKPKAKRKLSAEEFRKAWDKLNESGFAGEQFQKALCRKLKLSKSAYYRLFDEAF